ncbi:MAG: M15 family metallopeptidase [Candidatus Micrarchaeia archaeon]|jgi:hypothetical protein
MKFPIMQNQLLNLFGAPRDPASYLTTISLKEFAEYLGHVRDFEGNPWSLRIYGHELLAGPLRAAFQKLCGRGLAGELRTFDGCFNIRQMKGGSSYSVHSWGLAMDLNAGSNPFGGMPTLSTKFVQCFAESGFEWGGLWQPDSLRDGMHFQLPWIRDRGHDSPLFPTAWGEDVAEAPIEGSTPAPTIASAPIVQPGPSGESELLGNSEQFEPSGKTGQFKPDELALARKYLPIIQAAADAYTWPPELVAVMQQALGPNWMVWVLCGIASRESRFGLLLDAEGLGDGGHGHSIMQIDDRSHPAFCAGDDWKDLAASLEYVHKNVIVSSFNYLGDCCFNALGGDYAALFRASIAAYNCGPGNVRKALEMGDVVDANTTGGNYSRDVLTRAKGFQEVLG